MRAAGRVMPGRAAITTYLHALHGGHDARQGLRGGLAELPALISGCDRAAVTVGVHAVFSEVIATDPTSRRSEELQRTLHEGPTPHVLGTGYSVLCHDLRAEHRWPRWRDPATEQLGLGAVLAVPLHDQQRALGALTLYSPTAGGLSDTDIKLLHTLALPLTRTLIEARLASLAA